jgi:RNA polymerase sigma-70 factor (ECF subfamily)
MTHEQDRTDGTSSTLLHRVREEDPDAWHYLVELYGPHVYAWCRKSDLSPHDAADVLQEVFWAVASKVAHFRRDRPGDTFRGWLRTITRNKIHDHFRRLESRPEAPVSRSHLQRQAAPQETIPQQEDPSSELSLLSHHVLRRIRSEFTPRIWQAFWRTVVDGVSSADAAEELGMTPPAVRQARYRVMRRLREDLGDVE